MDRITAAHFRQRARHFRAVADNEEDPVQSAGFREIADIFDREADAIRDEEAKKGAGWRDIHPAQAEIYTGGS